MRNAAERTLRGGLLLSLPFILIVVGVVLSEEEKKEIPFPKLPKGAGEISEDADKEFQTTDSGLKYRILREGTGDKPKATQTIRVHYHGWLDNEKVFDSSYRREESIAFPLNGVIKGWTEGMQLVGEGGMIELEIPSKLAYGDRGAPPTIPPKATLHFLVELLKIE
jgi:FKBP-type peptidyl-prolyl cis-trans isomerase FkpA